MKFIFFGLTLSLISFSVLSQDVELTKIRVNTLASEKFSGRGYTNNAANNSADYIAEELAKAGVKSFNDTYFQNFYYSVNTFPSKLTVKLDGKTLNPGSDYLIGAASPSIKNKYSLFLPDSLLLNDTTKFKDVIKLQDFKQTMLVIDYAQTQNIDIKKFYIKQMLQNFTFAGVVELIPDELMWSVSTKQQNYPVVKIKRESYNRKASKIQLTVVSEFIPKFEAKNVIGFIPGEKDEFIVFTAHYDHLGTMGKKVYIPGAQDNASGTAMILDLADFYSKNKPEYSIAFMLFFGEEAGLLGSINYVLKPFFDLTKIKMLINLDMVGTGDEGITIVNGTEPDYTEVWDCFNNINIENEYFTILKARAKSANSDHYPFNEMGVKAVFIYSMGGKTYYHNPKDKPETLTYTGYNQLFGLLTKFVEEYR